MENKMCCFYNLMILIAVCVPLVYSTATAETLTSKPYKCGGDVILKCTIAGSCCTSDQRIWLKNGIQIMTDGNVVGIGNIGKYSEILGSGNDFFMIINSIKEQDFGMNFTCSYGFFTSLAVVLNGNGYFCPLCWDCVVQCLKYYFTGMVLGIVLQLIIYAIGFCCCKSHFYASCCHKSDSGGVYMKLYGKAYDIDKKKMLIISCVTAFLLTLGVFIFYLLVGLIPGGTRCLICYYSTEISLMSAGFGSPVYFFFCYLTLKWRRNCNGTTGVEGENTGGDKSFSTLRYVVYVVLTFFVLPLLVLVPYMCCKGGKSQSVESGSSCWPICRVGQDPNTSSSDPEKVRRSPEKERADKKKERKPTEVVRPQPSRPLPSRAQHLKTDNTGREEYSAENELFKPRPLPSISGHSDSPRPLPKRTPDDQLEKGGIQLEPLVDSTSEKKKKKKRKKKETKQSDEDD